MNLFNQINNYRKSQGEEPFVEDSQLCHLAEQRLSEIKTDWKHNIPISKCPSCTGMGEDLARGFRHGGTLDAWIASPSHNRILLIDHTFACVRSDDGYSVLLTANKILGASTYLSWSFIIVLVLVFWRLLK